MILLFVVLRFPYYLVWPTVAELHRQAEVTHALFQFMKRGYYERRANYRLQFGIWAVGSEKALRTGRPRFRHYA